MARNEGRPARATPGRMSRIETIRRQVLSEWRGGDEAPDLDAGVRRADDFVAAILRSAGLQDGIHEDELKAVWKELAGDFIASHSEPASVKGGHLVLRVTQPAMRFHLEQMKPMLLARIRGQLGEDRIRSVKFTLG
jgi:predicted nucleic acid-binding Zn ribbon protein